MQAHLKIISETTALLTAIQGAIVLAGWVFDIPVLRNIIPDFIAMKATTALCIILLGISLYLINNKKRLSIGGKIILKVFLLTIFAVGLFILGDYLFHFNFHIDKLLLKADTDINNNDPIRMSSVTAFDLCILAIVLWTLTLKKINYKLIQGLILLVFFTAILATSAYLNGVEKFYGISLHTKMSLHTALALIIFSTGVLCAQENHGIMALFTSSTTGGTIARRLIPVIIFVPLLCGWLRFMGEHHGWYESAFGETLFCVINLVIFVIIILWNSRHLMQLDLERKRMENNLKQKSEELAYANKELERFAYVASHDLQEPLRTISNFTEILEEKNVGQTDEESRQYFGFIIDATHRMQNLIKDLLELSKVGNELSIAWIDCNKIVEEVINEMQASIVKSNAHIKISTLPVFKGNRTGMKQLFQNLISNAIKFCKKNESIEIEIAANENESEFIFSVKDNGIGINDKYKEKIFIIFERVHNSNEYPGTGIGLATCKKIVSLHNGKIWVESELGKGSTFYFSISKKL